MGLEECFVLFWGSLFRTRRPSERPLVSLEISRFGTPGFESGPFFFLPFAFYFPRPPPFLLFARPLSQAGLLWVGLVV